MLTYKAVYKQQLQWAAVLSKTEVSLPTIGTSRYDVTYRDSMCI